MSKFFIDVVREEAAIPFPPAKNRKKGAEPFNVSKFSEAVYGKGKQKSWRSVATAPHTLTFDEAARMAEVLKQPFSELVGEANRRMRRASTQDAHGLERTGTLGG